MLYQSPIYLDLWKYTGMSDIKSNSSPRLDLRIPQWQSSAALYKHAQSVNREIWRRELPRYI